MKITSHLSQFMYPGKDSNRAHSEHEIDVRPAPSVSLLGRVQYKGLCSCVKEDACYMLNKSIGLLTIPWCKGRALNFDSRSSLSDACRVDCSDESFMAC
jgi:hypothetical protein